MDALRLGSFLICLVTFASCAGGTNRPPERWSGFGPLPLEKSSPLIPIPRANASLPILTDQQLEVKKIPEVKAPLPIPGVN
jgi:hypothetical protein